MITKLILKGYNRFFLNNIEEIEYTPKSIVQLILGSNGSGKSSLLKELNPLPINKNEFKEDGYKIIHIEKDNKKYVIYSDKSKNSFKVNDEELNPGGTKKVQLNLIESHFNLNIKSNNVLLGISKLTTMSTNERKEWLRQMSTVDYSYSIYLYNELKQKLRDTTGFIKIINNELSQDTSMLIKDEEVKEIKEEISLLKKFIEELSLSYKPVEDFKFSIVPDYDKLNTFKKLKEKNIEKYDYENIKSNIIVIENNIKDLDKEIENLTKEIDNIETYNTTTEEIKKLNSLLPMYQEYFNNLKKENIDLYFNITDADVLYQNFIKIENEINNTILELNYYDEVLITRTNFEEITSKKESLLFNINTITKNKFKLDGEYKSLMDNFKEDNKITCHNCGTESYFGYNKNLQIELENEIKKLEEILDNKNKVYESILIEHGKYVKKINLIKIIKDLFLDVGLLKYWNESLKETIGSLTSQQMMNIVLDIKYKLEISKDYTIRKKEYEDLLYKIKLDNEILNKQNEMLNASKDMLLEKLNNAIETKRNKKVEYDTNKTLLKDIEDFRMYYDDFLLLLKNYSKNKSIFILKSKNQVIKNFITDLKSKLIILEERYNDIDRIKSRIDKNKELIEKYEYNKSLLEKTVKALSPNEGLIAKSINSFINKFLLEMNTIINSVWSYDITLLPCQINEENDLDYKFSVIVDNKQPITDVSELSSSMKDIVDLSFRIVFMKYMHLSHMPLILDEFGITMDDKHRYNVYNVIENILINNFDQVFITAHFKSMYSRFLDSDIVVLDDKNIDLEKTVYNTSIVIK